VGAQTIPCEQVTIPDDIGIGIDGMYRAVPEHAHKLTGEYVHFLADDDYLATPYVAERVQVVAKAEGLPDVIIVQAIKNGLVLPSHTREPVCGQIDLGCVITRRDIWLQHVRDYSEPDAKYESDFQHVHAMWRAGRRFVFATDITFELGPAMHGAPE
jgi:hypothetical protein